MGLFTATIFALAAGLMLAWGVAVAAENGVWRFRDFGVRFGRQSWVARVFLGLFLLALLVYASTKPDGGDGDDDGRVGRASIRSVEDGSATNDVRTLTDEDFSRGLVLTRVGTNETFDFSAPAEAVVCEDWKNFGAAEDWFYLGFTNWGFKVAENEINWFKIFSNGLIEFSGESAREDETPRKWLAPFRASLGILPESNWDMLVGTSDGADAESNSNLESGISNQTQSCFWHCITPSNTLQLTWQNVLLERNPSSPVSFQTELWQNGRFAYRYNLSGIGEEEATNILTGALIGDVPFCTNALPRNVTSLSFYPLTTEDAVNPDRDGDGISLADELFVHRTDPELYDTDLDGVSDGEEIAAGTNPLLRNTDGDGLVDGSDTAPLEATSFADLDGDGIPDDYEIHWLGGTNVVDDASVRDETGFTLLAKLAAGVNPTNRADAVNVISSGYLASWKLFEPFAVELPAGTTNLVWERTFAVSRTSAWQQFFISSSPSNAAPWRIENAVLKWTTDNGDSPAVSSGSAVASPFSDSFRLPLAADDFPSAVTLRIRATGSGMVEVPKTLYLIAYVPEFKVEGGTDVTGESGAKFSVFMKGTKSLVGLKIDHSNRPHKAPVGSEECDFSLLQSVLSFDRNFLFEGDVHGGTIKVLRPGVCELPSCTVGVGSSSGRRSTKGAHSAKRIVVLDPSVRWSCYGRDCLHAGLQYSWETDEYGENDGYPLDSKCLRKKWHSSWTGVPLHDNCELNVISGVGNADWVSISTDGNTGKIKIDGVDVWSGSAEHFYGSDWCSGGYEVVKCEKWRASSQDAVRTDEDNAYSYEVKYTDTGADTPLLMRNAIAEAMDENGVLTQNTYSLTNGILTVTSRKSYNGNALPVYSVTERDAVYGNVVRRTERLTDSDAIIADERSVYDEKNRLRSTAYLDGTSITNHYSCCRLLWKRDREGRTTLRSAKTGSDHLYYAMEDVWLGEISTNGEYRITQHFYDALGRETNVVSYVGTAHGEAEEKAASNGKACSRITTEYPNGGSGYSVTRDERGKVTERFRTIEDDCISDLEIVYTNSVEAIRTESRKYNGGGTSIRKEWNGKFTEERRFDEYNPEGCRVSCEIAESSDYGTVTNSVSEYDLLGRLVSSRTPLGVMVYTYDGASTRVNGQTVTSGPIVRNATMLYNEYGEQVGVLRDGVTTRTDTEYETDASNIVWRVTAERTFGEKANACVTTRVRLTGLPDTCRSETVRNDHSGKWSRTTRAFDAESGLETETVESSYGNNSSLLKKYGIVFQTSQPSGVTCNAFDAFGRIVQETHADSCEIARKVRSFEYAPDGDLIATHISTNVNVEVTERYGYDCFGNRTETVDALGNVTHREYDVFGNVVEEFGATYPVRYEYDTQNRMISLSTTHDGVTWNVTRWIYDGVTGLCKRKVYADGSEVNYSHTADGLPLRTTYAEGRWFENVYNEKREVAGVVTSGGDGDASYLRDEFGREISEICNPATIQYSFSDAGIATNEFWTIGNATSSVVRLLDPQGRIAFNNGMHCRYAEDGKLSMLSNALAKVEYLYSSDRLDAGYRMTLADGNEFERRIVRDEYRRELIANVSSRFNGSEVETFAYSFDALGRPVARNTDTFGYNRRSEAISATIDSHTAHYAYDHIGNCRTSILNGSVTNNFLANCLNQYTFQLRLSAAPRETIFSYDADGNQLSDGIFAYTYDSKNRLKTVSSNSTIIVENFYDAKSRRVRKVTSSAMYAFFYDEWNLIEERISYANGEASLIKYYWGKDLSGAIQGAGGIGGVLYLTIDGQVYIPCYDNNGNVTMYLDASGNIVAAYTYDAFGKTIFQSGALAEFFRHRFSTKYFDAETGLYYYGYRFYHPELMRWLNRDPMEERGGLNLYGFCGNNAILRYDPDGRAYFALRKLKGFVWLGPLSHNPLFDVLNIEIAHELVFFEDNGVLNDFGFSENGVGQEKPEDLKEMTYRVTDSGYNDCVMRKAVDSVQFSGDDYSVFWFAPRMKKCNCQDYCSALRRKYEELMEQKEVRCECGVK